MTLWAFLAITAGRAREAVASIAFRDLDVLILEVFP
jgi:hypothetical protein